jgi:hypothetical protein
MAEGFLVDHEAVRQATDGITGTIEAFNRQPVSSIPFDSSAVGSHQGLVSSTSSFLSGWQRGVQNLVTDAVTAAGALVQALSAYDKADGAAAAAVGAVGSTVPKAP